MAKNSLLKMIGSVGLTVLGSLPLAGDLAYSKDNQISNPVQPGVEVRAKTVYEPLLRYGIPDRNPDVHSFNFGEIADPNKEYEARVFERVFSRHSRDGRPHCTKTKYLELKDVETNTSFTLNLGNILGNKDYSLFVESKDLVRVLGDINKEDGSSYLGKISPGTVSLKFVETLKPVQLPLRTRTLYERVPKQDKLNPDKGWKHSNDSRKKSGNEGVPYSTIPLYKKQLPDGSIEFRVETPQGTVIERIPKKDKPGQELPDGTVEF